jgi:hypothetical protein
VVFSVPDGPDATPEKLCDVTAVGADDENLYE